MRKTVVGTFDARADAEQVAAILIERGFDSNDIDLRSTGATSGTASRESTSWWEWLFGESEDRSYYSERLDRGGAILAVTTDEEGVERARRLMEAEGGDVEAHAADVETSRGEAPARGTREGAARRETTGRAQGDEEVVPVVEERLRVGKRPVARGGVRIYSRVAEHPVEERVPLREEQVRVERRPVDRPVGDAVAAFREDVIEITEHGEEAVIAKEARVVEEVVVSKDVEERVEDVRDRVRRTEIDVERTPGGPEAGAYQAEDPDFRRHWTETGRQRGLSYEHSDIAYRFGHGLAGDAREWSAIEPEARRRWEERNPGTWDRFVDAIRYAWERARGRRRAA